MLEWHEHSRTEKAILYIGMFNGEVYAHVIDCANGIAFYQFRGLCGAELNSGELKETDSLKTAKKICTVMMGAWKHKLN